jgi:Ser/Thr protein kinase RdoA (MazF antagonist)
MDCTGALGGGEVDEKGKLPADIWRHYPLQVKSVEGIGQSASMVYKVTDVEENSYSLRLHSSKSEALDESWTDTEVIRSEMVWLEALSEETDMILPKPYRNNGGEYVTDVGGVSCTLLSWVEGEQKAFIPTAKDAGAVGAMIGKLHKQASCWTAPPAFSRPSFDGERIGQALGRIAALPEEGYLGQDQAELIASAGRRALLMMDGLARTPDYWGMIHADLIPSNYVFCGGEVRPIDFGACGFGYYLVDIGWAFSYIHPSHRQRLLESYAEHFALPPGHEELLEGFFVAAQLETVNFWLGLPDAMEWLPGHLSKLTEREFKQYAEGRPFLYTGTPYWK